MRLKVSGGTVVVPGGRFEADVVADGGVVVAIEVAGRGGKADEVVDARGKLVFPGFIDPHVHSRDPGQVAKEDFAHSTRAAVAGGVTTILEMPNAIPPITDAATFRSRAEYLGQNAAVDFGLWALAVGTENLAELAGLFASGAVGVKLFWGYSLNRHTLQLVYNPADEAPEELVPPPGTREVYELFRAVAAAGGLLAAHCEERGVLDAAAAAMGHPVGTYAELLQSRPAAAEAVAVAMAAEFAASTGCRFHVVHMSTARAATVVRQAQSAGISISAETCPHFLTLSEEDYKRIGPLMKVYPPVRSRADQEALWVAVNDGTIASIGSDHAPHTASEKAAPLATCPAGVIGVETMAPLLIDAMLRGRTSAETVARTLSEGTAKIFGLFPAKGSLRPGADADITIVDPAREHRIDNGNLHSKHPLSPWHGATLKGRVERAILRGETVMHDGEVLGVPRGRLVRPSRPAGTNAMRTS